MERRQLATSAEVRAALDALGVRPRRVPAESWPGDLPGLAAPGLYSWWADKAGAADLSHGLGHVVQPGRIYAGLTGATKWPSGATGRATLRSRIGNNHLRGRIRGSTFRFTLAAALQRSLKLQPAGPKTLDSQSERRLSEWIAEHLELAVFPFPDADALADLEHRVLRALDPPLNLDGMEPTPLRTTLRGRRQALSAAAVTPSPAPTAASEPKSSAQPASESANVAEISSFIQDELRRRRLHEAAAVDVADWLDKAGLLSDSQHRPGLRLRKLLRAGLIEGAEQRPPQTHGRWILTRLTG